MDTSVFLLIKDDEGVTLQSVHGTFENAVIELEQIVKGDHIYTDSEIGDRTPYFFSMSTNFKLRASTYFAEWFIIECPVL